MNKQNEPATDNLDFEAELNKRQTGHLRDVIDFMLSNKKWWLTPIVVLVLLISALIVLSGTAVGPFIYTLF
jgi:hypothetical protein